MPTCPGTLFYFILILIFSLEGEPGRAQALKASSARLYAAHDGWTWRAGPKMHPHPGGRRRTAEPSLAGTSLGLYLRRPLSAEFAHGYRASSLRPSSRTAQDWTIGLCIHGSSSKLPSAARAMIAGRRPGLSLTGVSLPAGQTELPVASNCVRLPKVCFY